MSFDRTHCALPRVIELRLAFVCSPRALSLFLLKLKNWYSRLGSTAAGKAGSRWSTETLHSCRFELLRCSHYLQLNREMSISICMRAIAFTFFFPFQPFNQRSGAPCYTLEAPRCLRRAHHPTATTDAPNR